MPFVIPVVVAIGYMALSAAVSIGMNYLAQAILKPASKSPSPTPSQSTTSGQKIGIEQKQTTRQGTAARRIIYGRALVGGVYGFQHVNNLNQTLFMTILWAGHRCESIQSYRVDEEPVTLQAEGFVATGRYAGNLRFIGHLGDESQVVDDVLLNSLPDKWDASMRGVGICYSTVVAFWDNQGGDGDKGSKVWTGGIPNLTAVVHGKFVYDPRLGDSVWTDNAALCVADFLCDPVYGMGVDYATGIDEDALIAAANVCDEELFLADGVTTQKRFTVNGYFDSDAKPDEILGRLLAAMYGKAIYDGDVWIIYAGNVQTATLTLTDDDLIAPSNLQTLASARDTYNGVKGRYVEWRINWEGMDFPAVRSNYYKSLDGGIERIKDVEFPFTIFVETAQRLARIDLVRSRQELVEQFPGRLACWRARAGDVVYRDSERYGWVQKPFEVESIAFTATPGEGDGPPVFSTSLVLQEVDPAIDDRNANEELGIDTAPNTNFPSIHEPGPPGPLTLTETKDYSRYGAGVQAVLNVEWEASQDKFVEKYVVAYRRLEDADLIFRPEVVGLEDHIEGVTAGTYEVSVYPMNWAGVLGTSARSASIAIVGLADKPDPVENFTISPAGNVFGWAQWTLASELDVREGGEIHIRFSPLNTGATWSNGRSVVPPQPGSQTSVQVPLMTGTYLVKKRDSSGTWSDEVSFVQRQQSAVEFTIVGGFTLTEHPDFPGAKTNVFVDAATDMLMLVGVDDFDSVVDVDALPVWDFPGGIVTGTETSPAGTYAWQEAIDLGAKTRVRLTIDMRSQVFDTFDDFDSREGDVDDWPSWDGTVTGAEADAWHMVRTTEDDDPADGGAVWSEWQRVDVGEYDVRGIQIRTHLNSIDTVYNIGIDQLSARVELPT